MYGKAQVRLEWEMQKKLTIASVLSMMTASCYAGSIVAGTEQQVSADIAFVSPQQLSVTFAQVPNLTAGRFKTNTEIATIAVSSSSAKKFAIAADFHGIALYNGDTWNIRGKNTGKAIIVYFYGEAAKPQGSEVTMGISGSYIILTTNLVLNWLETRLSQLMSSQ